MKQWVVDTWVLVKCQSAEDLDCYFDGHELLIRILNSDRLCLDVEGEIQKEYYRNMVPRSFVARWWEEMRKRGKFQWYSNELEKKHRRHLTEKLHFDPSDVKFVGVARRATDHLLVSQDSDYTDTVCQYLKDRMSVHVLPLAAARRIE